MTLDKKEEKVFSILIADIISNEKLKRTIKNEDIERIADNIKSTGKIVPIIVRKVGKKFQWVTGQEVLEAFKHLGKKEIPAIVRDLTDDEACEFALASLRHNTDISSEEHEDQVYAQWIRGYESGRYKTITDYSKRICYSDRQTSDLIKGKIDRIKIFGNEGTSDHISTETLRAIKTLLLPEKKKFCDRIKDGKIYPSDAREAVNFLNSKSVSAEIKEAILNGDTIWRDAKEIFEKQLPLLKELEKAVASYYKKDVIQKIVEDEKPHFSVEPFRLLSGFKMAIDPIYFEKINSETEKKQAILYYKIDGIKTFRDLHKLGIIDSNKYHTVCKIVGIEPERIEQLKDDGHYYFFPDEWIRPTEKKLKEKLNKLLTGKDEPLFN